MSVIDDADKIVGNEPILRKCIIIFLIVYFFSFLQLYIFNPQFVINNYLISISLTFGISIAWITLQFPASFLFFLIIGPNKDKTLQESFQHNIVISIFGFAIMAWMIILTYVAFELSLTIEGAIRTSLLFMVFKSLAYAICFVLVGVSRNKNK